MQELEDTHDLFTKEIKPLKSAHCLRASLYIAENNMSLTAHLRSFQCHNVEDWTVGRKQRVE